MHLLLLYVCRTYTFTKSISLGRLNSTLPNNRNRGRTISPILQSVASRVSSVSQVTIDWRNFSKTETMEGGLLDPADQRQDPQHQHFGKNQPPMQSPHRHAIDDDARGKMIKARFTFINALVVGGGHATDWTREKVTKKAHLPMFVNSSSQHR